MSVNVNNSGGSQQKINGLIFEDDIKNMGGMVGAASGNNFIGRTAGLSGF